MIIEVPLVDAVFIWGNELVGAIFDQEILPPSLVGKLPLNRRLMGTVPR